MRLSKAEAATYGRRASVSSREKRWCIEGESVTVTDIAARIGRSERVARERLQAAQASDGPVTWGKLVDKG